MQINARAMTGAVISRHKHNEQIAIPTAQTILHEETTYKPWVAKRP